MNEQNLFDAITNVDEKHIIEAKETKLKRRGISKQGWRAMAACAVLAVAIFGVTSMMTYFGGSSDGGSMPSEGAGGGSEGTVFMSYAGPVFPMTMQTGEDGIRAIRNVDYDFAPYEPVEQVRISGDGEEISYTDFDTETIVTDSYTLTNTSNEDKTIRLLYPVAADLNDDARLLPSITVNGENTETTLHYGSYSGDFIGITGHEEAGLFNLEPLGEWSDYEELLADGSYIENMFEPYLSLEQNVTVYKFTNHSADFSQGENPTMAMFFNIDDAKSTTLTYQFNGGGFSETGDRRVSYSIPDGRRLQYGDARYFIVIGEDIDGYTLQGYQNGGCEPGEEIDSARADVERYETTLGDVLVEISKIYLAERNSYEEYTEIMEQVDIEDYIGLMSSLLHSYGILSEEPIERYAYGMLDDILQETMSMDRLLYTAFDVTIPAGESINVTAQMIKEASFDYHGAGSANEGLNGFDMVTSLGSNILFTEQSASIQNGTHIDIKHQNFGFDVEAGITSVVLDSTVEHYYLEVTAKEE